MRKLLLDYRLILALAALLILPLISRQMLISYMDTTFMKASNTMERHFKGLYYSEHLRNLSNELDLHITRYSIWRDESYLPVLPQSKNSFRETLDKLREVYQGQGVEESKLLDKIGRLEKQKVQLLDTRLLQIDPKTIDIHKFLREEFQPLNTDLKKTIGELIVFERKEYISARNEMSGWRKRVMDRLTYFSVFSFIIAVFLFIFVLYLVQKLRNSLHENIKAVQARDDVLAVVSHDLKNPLSAISLNSQLLLKNLSAEEPKNTMIIKLLKSIQKSTQVMTDLIQGLLDSVKIEAGNFELDLQEADFKEIIRETESVLVPLAKDKSIAITNVLPANPTIVTCDKKRMMQVLSNLIGNAVKFLDRGGEIEVEAHKEGHLLKVSVSDTGPGIPEEDLPHLFDRYWQARKTAKQGTGLGLSIVYNLIKAHGGRIWVESKLNQGTRFTFTVPLASP